MGDITTSFWKEYPDGEDEFEIPIEVTHYSVGNDTFSHAFGTEYKPDYIEDYEFEIQVAKLNPKVLKLYSMQQLYDYLEETIDSDKLCRFIEAWLVCAQEG